MYMEIIDFLKKQFVRDSLIGGFFIGLGQFCMFAANCAVLYAAKKYILKGEIDSEDMGLAMNIVMTSASGIGQGMGNLGDLKKLKLLLNLYIVQLTLKAKYQLLKMIMKEK